MATKKESQQENDAEKDPVLEECFLIMPISDQPGYDPGHFTKVYEDIFKPACAAAGYAPTRADDSKQSNLIHLDILKRVVHSPMAICDLSGRNPNVLFELGLRQAFDKPTVLVKDYDTGDIFDIAPIRYTQYRKELRYREVLENQKEIADALRSTKGEIGKQGNVNSLIRLLELTAPATAHVDGKESDPRELFQILMAEMSQMRRELRDARNRPTPVEVAAPPFEAGQASLGFLKARVLEIKEKMEAGASSSDVISDIVDTIAWGKGFIKSMSNSGSSYDRMRVRAARALVEDLELMQLV